MSKDTRCVVCQVEWFSVFSCDICKTSLCRECASYNKSIIMNDVAVSTLCSLRCITEYFIKYVEHYGQNMYAKLLIPSQTRALKQIQSSQIEKFLCEYLISDVSKLVVEHI